MADNFGLKIGLEGEKEFKKALADINQSFKVLGSEMKVVQSQFDKNDDSVEALTARNQVLGKEIDAQKKKIETLRQGAGERFHLFRGERPAHPAVADPAQQRPGRSEQYGAGA